MKDGSKERENEPPYKELLVMTQYIVNENKGSLCYNPINSNSPTFMFRTMNDDGSKEMSLRKKKKRDFSQVMTHGTDL
jgi:hypothetical protein